MIIEKKCIDSAKKGYENILKLFVKENEYAVNLIAFYENLEKIYGKEKADFIKYNIDFVRDCGYLNLDPFLEIDIPKFTGKNRNATYRSVYSCCVNSIFNIEQHVKASDYIFRNIEHLKELLLPKFKKNEIDSIISDFKKLNNK